MLDTQLRYCLPGDHQEQQINTNSEEYCCLGVMIQKWYTFGKVHSKWKRSESVMGPKRKSLKKVSTWNHNSGSPSCVHLYGDIYLFLVVIGFGVYFVFFCDFRYLPFWGFSFEHNNTFMSASACYALYQIYIIFVLLPHTAIFFTICVYLLLFMSARWLILIEVCSAPLFRVVVVILYSLYVNLILHHVYLLCLLIAQCSVWKVD